MEPHRVIQTRAAEVGILPAHSQRQRNVIHQRGVREVGQRRLMDRSRFRQRFVDAHPHELRFGHRLATRRQRRIDVANVHRPSGTVPSVFAGLRQHEVFVGVTHLFRRRAPTASPRRCNWAFRPAPETTPATETAPCRAARRSLGATRTNARRGRSRRQAAPATRHRPGAENSRATS